MLFGLLCFADSLPLWFKLSAMFSLGVRSVDMSFVPRSVMPDSFVFHVTLHIWCVFLFPWGVGAHVHVKAGV